MFCGPKFGMLRSVLAATLLADFDFSAPAAVGIGGTGSFSSAYATDEWEDFSTGTVPNIAGTETLANTSGLTDRDTQLWDGTDFSSIRGWESTDTAANDSYLVSSGSTAGDSDNEDVSFRLVCRFNKHLAGAYDYVLSKFGSAGWALQSTPSGFRILIDSVAAVYTSITDSLSWEGSWTCIEMFYDHSAKVVYVKTSNAAEVSASVSAASGSITAGGTALAVNKFSGGTTSGLPQIQVAYVGVSVGANAQNFYDEEIVLPGADPGAYDTDKTALTTKTRGSLVSVPISATGVCHFANDTLPLGYKSAFTDTNKLGLFTNSARVNLSAYSEALSNWTQSGTTTTTDNDGDSPDGFRSMSKITAGAANDFIKELFTTVAATEYTVSVLIEESTVGVTGRVIFYDETGTVELASQVFTGTGLPQEVSVTATTNAGQISSSCMIEIDTSGESVYAWGAQYNLGDSRGDTYVRTNGGSASLVASNYKVVGTAGQYCKAAAGEIEAVWVSSFAATPNANAYLIDCSPTGSNNNRVALLAESNGDTPRAYVYDSGGTLQANITSGVQDTDGQQNTVVLRWDETGGLAAGGGEDATIKYNADAEVADVGSYTTADLITDIQIGAYRGHLGANDYDACIQRLRIWDGERA